MPSYTIYILLGSLIFGMNVAPMLMPATWIVLTYFFITFHLAFVPTILIGVVAATLGRLVLAIIARNYFQYLFPQQMKENYLSLGEFLNRHKRLMVPLIITYMFIPIPSNQVFIAAGLANLDLTLLGVSFFIGRLISYTFWVSAAQLVTRSLESIFFSRHVKSGAIISEIIGLVALVLLGLVPWKKILKKQKPHHK